MLPRARLSSERHTHTSTLTLTPISLLPGHLNNNGLDRWDESDGKSKKCIGWKCRWDFYVAILSFATDSSGWTRLTSSCLEYGASYLAARVTAILLIGTPLLFFEISVGQLSRMGPWKFFGSSNLRPIFSGVGVFLLITSVYKAVSDAASSLQPISDGLSLLFGDIEALNSTLSDQMGMQGFTHLDALTVISLSITWVLTVLTVICGVRFICKFSYFTLLVPWLLIVILIGRAIYLDSSQVHEGLSLFLTPNWSSLLSLSLWTRAVTDTILSLNLGYGVVAFLSSLNTRETNCLKSSITLVILHTVTLSLMLVLAASSAEFIKNDKLFESLAAGMKHASNESWMVAFYVIIFMSNVDTLIFISNMLATSLSNISWRPVLAVLIGAFLYVICLPLATRSKEMYQEMMQNFVVNILPMMSVFLMLVASACSLRPSSLVDVFEIAGKFKLAFRGQSYVFVGYSTTLPLLITVCIIDGLVRLNYGHGIMSALGCSLLCLPWAGFIFAPLYVLVCQ